jgi:Cysteine-rich secretory protein family
MNNRGLRFAAFMFLLIFSVSCLDDLLPEELGETSGAALVERINDYRAEKGLDQIPQSSALMKTAKNHVVDLLEHDPVHGDCNLHSWSGSGDWSACCYTDDHANAECMWNKPGEIAGYSGNGYEIAAWAGDAIDAEGALEQWKGSQGHHDVILNRGTWEDNQWLAIGAAIKGGFAVVWFGEVPD